MATYRYIKVWAPDHPLRGKRGEVFQHRMVLYDEIGPGWHPCHWCGVEVEWRVRGRGVPTTGELSVDHLDGDKQNNEPGNLVPCCRPCNTRDGYNPARVTDDEAHIVRASGTRLRASTSVCQSCGESFVHAPLDVGRYCSRTCSYESKRRAVCSRGHDRVPENVSPANQCRECLREASARHNEKRRAARQAARRSC